MNVYKAYATKFSYLVIYELLHGTKEKADEYITQMIDWVEKIRVPGKDNAPIQHQKSLARLSRREKREIRERFFHLGLLDHLPKNGGWSDTMQDPRIRDEKRKKQREDRKAICQVLREPDRRDGFGSDWWWERREESKRGGWCEDIIDKESIGVRA